MFLGTEVLGGLIYVIIRDVCKVIFNFKDTKKDIQEQKINEIHQELKELKNESVGD